jgi:hypothetical protein
VSFTQKDFTEQLCKELVLKYGSIEEAARQVADKCVSERFKGRPVAARTVKGWIADALPRAHGHPTRPTSERLLDAGRVTRAVVGTYEVVTVNRDTGEPTVTTAHKSSLTLVPDTPGFPLIQPATPTTLTYNPGPYILKPITYRAVISDAQIGYLRHQETGEMEPIHDPRALDVAQQIVGDVRPTGLYWIGDWMDWPTFSRWQKYPEYHGTVQPSIETGYQELGKFITAAGEQCKTRVMIGSNHGARPEKFLLEYNMDALGIRQAGTPTSWPVFSEPFLLRFDDYNIQFSGQYPGGHYYVLQDLVLTHAPPKKLEFQASVIHGHTHKLTRTTTVAHGFNGRQTYFVYDTGCLCSLEATTDARRLLVTRVPSDRARTDWAQGISIVAVIDGKIPRHEVEQVTIRDGAAIYHDKTYEARNPASALDPSRTGVDGCVGVL